MSALVFPTLPGLDVEVSRDAKYKTKIFETVSGKEQRIAWENTPRYTYKLKFNVLRDDVAAPAPYAAYSEVGALLYFLDTHKGSWDSFTFTDPYDATSRTVRLVDDSLTVTSIVPHYWSAELSLISVK
jgi:hypothetical protein